MHACVSLLRLMLFCFCPAHSKLHCWTCYILIAEFRMDSETYFCGSRNWTQPVFHLKNAEYINSWTQMYTCLYNKIVSY
jgi:hypothetical protein